MRHTRALRPLVVGAVLALACACGGSSGSKADQLPTSTPLASSPTATSTASTAAHVTLRIHASGVAAARLAVVCSLADLALNELSRHDSQGQHEAAATITNASKKLALVPDPLAHRLANLLATATSPAQDKLAATRLRLVCQASR